MKTGAATVKATILGVFVAIFVATSGDTRLPGLPDVPTFRETGLANYEAGYRHGLLARAGTPADTLHRISGEIARILAMPEVREKLVSEGSSPFISTPEEFGALMKADTAST